MHTLSDFTARVEASARARMFSRIVYAHGLAQERGWDVTKALEWTPGTLDYFKKAGVGVGTGTNLPALDPGDGYARGFVDLYTPKTVRGQLVGALNAPANVVLPRPTSEPIPAWVREGAGMPVARIELDAPRTATAKFGFIIGYDRSLWDRVLPEAAISMVEAISTRALIRTENRLLLSDTAAVAGEAPAGLLNGVNAIGSGSPASIADLSELWASVRDGEPADPLFICSGRGALYLASMNVDGQPQFPTVSATGVGSIAGCRQLAAAAAGENLILVDASQIAFTDGGLEIVRSDVATVQLVDTATINSATAVAANLTSAFQTNARLVKFVRHLSWLKLATDAVGFVTLPIGGSPA
jgi:hypothetical protein